jgi:hypothetical protein
MSDPIRTFRHRGRVVAKLLGIGGLLLPAVAGTTSAGCSLAFNLDDLRNATGHVEDASFGAPAPVFETQLSATDADAPVDSAFRGPDGAAPQPNGDASDPGPQPIGTDDSHPPVLGIPTEAGPGALETPMSRPDASDGRDATTVTMVRDAGTSTKDAALDVGTDAKMDADLGVAANDAGTWCAAHRSATTVDCYDFDEGQPALFGFASHYFTGNYASVISTDFAPGSRPSALLVSTPSLFVGAPPEYQQFGEALSFHPKVEVSFAVKIVGYDPNAPDVSLFRIAYQNGVWGADFDLLQGGAGFVETPPLLFGGTKRSTYPAVQPSPIDAWTTVDCLFDFVNHTVSLSYNGVAVVSGQPIANPDQIGPIAPNILTEMGLNYLGAPAKPMLIYYDDILLTTPP